MCFVSLSVSVRTTAFALSLTHLLLCPQIFVDDVLVYKGNLERSPEKEYFASEACSSSPGARAGDDDR